MLVDPVSPHFQPQLEEQCDLALRTATDCVLQHGPSAAVIRMAVSRPFFPDPAYVRITGPDRAANEAAADALHLVRAALLAWAAALDYAALLQKLRPEQPETRPSPGQEQVQRLTAVAFAVAAEAVNRGASAIAGWISRNAQGYPVRTSPSAPLLESEATRG